MRPKTNWEDGLLEAYPKRSDKPEHLRRRRLTYLTRRTWETSSRGRMGEDRKELVET